MRALATKNNSLFRLNTLSFGPVLALSLSLSLSSFYSLALLAVVSLGKPRLTAAA